MYDWFGRLRSDQSQHNRQTGVAHWDNTAARMTWGTTGTKIA